jgi:uncharacterized protein (TIGR00725 family)
MESAGRVRRRPIVGVIGSGDPDLTAPERLLPSAVGRWIAGARAHLLTGGGAGVMEAAAEGFCSVEHEGLSIGVLPAGRPRHLYPNRWVELPIVTHLRGEDPLGADSRNHINVLTCHALVAFPGRGGTRAELELALARRPPCPVIAAVAPGQSIGGLDAGALRALGVAVVEGPAERRIAEIAAYLQQALVVPRAED